MKYLKRISEELYEMFCFSNLMKLFDIIAAILAIIFLFRIIYKILTL